jgi:hypothetical protein
MQSWVALIASGVIGSMVLLSFNQFSNDAVRELYIDTLDNAVYTELDAAGEIIEYDFSRIGLGVNDPNDDVLTQADSTDLRYVMDVNGDNTFETMRYYLSGVSAAASTPNPNDRYLYRVVNGGANEAICGGVTDFKITYFDVSGNETAVLNDIKTFVIYLQVESAIGYDGEYPKLVWEGRVTPLSLMTR